MNKNDEKLFNEMAELVNLQNEDEFLFFIDKNAYLLKVDPILFIGNHISFYAEQEDVKKALEVVNFYKNSPYISMEVEDFLNEMYEELSSISSQNRKDYDEKQIRRMLFSSNEEARSSALHYLSKQNIRNFIPLIQDYLLLDIPYKYKTLALFILIDQNVSMDIKVSKNDRIYTYKPSSLTLPFEDDSYVNCKNVIEKNGSSRPDISKLAIELLNTIQIKIFPDSLIDDDYELMADLLLDIARICMKEETQIDNIVIKHQITDLEDLDYKVKEINRIILE